MSLPCVSVIIPCFNDGQYLRDAIGSVEKCDDELYEIIIVDDGSSDENTQRILFDLEQRGYRVIRQENQGLGASRNTGIRSSRGRYFLPLDADNIIHADYVKVGVSILDKQPDVAVVYGNREFFGEKIVGPQCHVVGELDLQKLAIWNYIDACAVIRKEAWEQCGGYDVNMPHQGWEDWELWLNLASRGWKFYYEDRVMFSYRLRGDSLSASMLDTEKLNRVIEYLASKHGLLLRQLVVAQYEELERSKERYQELLQLRATRYSRLWQEGGLRAVLLEAVNSFLRRFVSSRPLY